MTLVIFDRYITLKILLKSFHEENITRISSSMLVLMNGTHKMSPHSTLKPLKASSSYPP